MSHIRVVLFNIYFWFQFPTSLPLALPLQGRTGKCYDRLDLWGS